MKQGNSDNNLGNKNSATLFPDIRANPQGGKVGNDKESPRPSFEVNEFQCLGFTNNVPHLIELREATDSFALVNMPPKSQIRSLFYLVGICDRMNWDFTLGPLAKNLWNITDGFSADSVRSLNERTFREAFGSYRRKDGPIKYLDRMRRLQLLARYCESYHLSENLESCDMVHGSDGALELLKRAPAYSEDPLFKKCNALMHELVRRKLVIFSDANAIEPAVDYHIIRLYLRTGRVSPLKGEIIDRLVQRRRVRIELLTELRRTLSKAMIYTAWLAKTTVSLLNDVEWAFARKECRRNSVACSKNVGDCPLSCMCVEAGKAVSDMITEPKSMHGHY